MKHLAISKTPYYLAYAVFDNLKLVAYGTIRHSQPSERKRLVEWEDMVISLIEDYRPTFLLTHLLNKERTMKKDIEKIVEVRTIMKLACAKHNVIYAEFKTSGWEKKITGSKPTTHRKLKLVNDSYDLDIQDIEIANAIILAEGVAHNRLQIGA